MTIPGLTPASARQAIAKIRWTVPPILPTGHIWHSDYHLSGPVKDVLHGHHSAHNNELKQSFSAVLRSQGREFYNTAIWCLTQHW
jgi:hypothetical protein